MEPRRISVSDTDAACAKCGVNILDIRNFKYSGKTMMSPEFREELCECRHCGAEFILRYNIFDKNGHIEQRVFTGDINDPEYNWQDSLVEDQKKAIADHLKKCKLCNDRLEDEVLTDAWFASVIHEYKKEKK